MSPDPVLAVGLLLGAVGLGLTAPDLRRSLRTDQAPTTFAVLALGTYALWYLIAALALVQLVPWPVPIAAFILPVGALLGSPYLLAWDRDHNREALRRSYYEIIDAAKRGDLTQPEFRALRRRIAGLSRYKRPGTRGWIDLVQAEMSAWADGSAATDPAVERRILELGDQVFGARVIRARPGTSGDIR